MLQDLPQDLIDTATDLLEARRNPDQNPRIGPLSRLEEYKNDPKIYISFTEIDKAGLKPLSDYNTPLGVYTYPLKVSWDYYNVDKVWKNYVNELRKEIEDSLSNPYDIYSPSPSKMASAELNAIDEAFPFATRNPYIQVLKAKKPLTDLQKFSERDFDNAMSMIEKLLPALSLYDFDMSSYLDLITKRNARIESPGGRFWYLTYILTNEKEQSKAFKSSNSLNDKNATTILENESFLKKYKTNSSMRAWNYLLRELGHEGFHDNGDSIIHPGEPAQAVFLTKRAFEKVDLVLNKPSEISKKKKRVRGTWMNKNKISGDAKWYIEEKGGVYTKDFIRWESGTFIDGVFEWGVFKGGTFEGGTFKNSTFKGGTFAGGTFKDDIFTGGTFAGGTFAGGTFKGDTFTGGTFAGGTFRSGVFEGGTFEGGTFNGGFWLNGEWKAPRDSWERGLIYSDKFEQYVYSKVEPPRFYDIEFDSRSWEELEDMLD